MRKAALLLPLLVTACAYTGEPTGGPISALVSASGQTLGTVRAWDTPGGVTFRIEARGLPLGIHGVHIHAVGRCDPPGFTTAGAHWNPAGRQHGFNNPAGAHAGDLPNISVAANGVVHESVTLPRATYAQLLDGDGSALVVHAAADDYRTDPSGNSGARIACAVLQPLIIPTGR
jgi:Cu-Zn family superoxide dismutase